MEELTGDLNRIVGMQCISAGLVPDYNVAMVCFTGEVTLYISLVDGKLNVEVDAPCLQ